MKKWLIVLACVVYVVSPIDILPEAFLGPLGLGDDLVVGLIGLRTMFRS